MKTPSGHKQYLRKEFPLITRLDEFSEAEIVYLRKYGAWLAALMNGDIEPITEKQNLFRETCLGDRHPVLEHELLWRRYLLAVSFEYALRRESNLSAGNGTYAEVRSNMAKLARAGSLKAQEWLEKEGEWEDLPSEGFSNILPTNRVWEIGAIHHVSAVFNSGGYADDSPIDVSANETEKTDVKPS